MITINDTVNKEMLKRAADDFLCQGIDLFSLLEEIGIDLEGVDACGSQTFEAPHEDEIAISPVFEFVGTFAKIQNYSYTGSVITIDWSNDFPEQPLNVRLLDNAGNIFTNYTYEFNEDNTITITLQNPPAIQQIGTVTLSSI